MFKFDNFFPKIELKIVMKKIVLVFVVFFNYYCNNLSDALYSFLIIFYTTNKILLTFIRKNKLKKLKIENVYKHLENSQNIKKKFLSSIGIDKIMV